MIIIIKSMSKKNFICFCESCNESHLILSLQVTGSRARATWCPNIPHLEVTQHRQY